MGREGVPPTVDEWLSVVSGRPVVCDAECGGGIEPQRSCARIDGDSPSRTIQKMMGLILYGLGKTEVFQEDGGPVLQKDRDAGAVVLRLRFAMG